MNYLMDAPVKEKPINYTIIRQKIRRITELENKWKERKRILFSRLPLDDEERRRNRVMPTLNDVMESSCRYFMLTELELTRRCREGDLPKQRFVAIYVAKKLTSGSLGSIARRFNLTHTMTLHGDKSYKILHTQKDMEWMEKAALTIEKNVLKKYNLQTI